jgi:TonB family protein
MSTPAVPSLLVAKQPAWSRYVFISLAGHVGVVVAALIFSKIFDAPPLDLSQKPIHASLVRLGTPREKDLLPRKEEPPPPPPKAAEAPPAPTPPPPEKTVAVPSLKPAPPVQKTSGAKSGDPDRKKLFSAFNTLSKSAGKDDPEGALDGDRNGDAAKAEGERYYGLLKARVQQYYDLPNTLSDQEKLRLKAAVHIFIGRTGQLLKVKADSSSGNALFDQAVLTATKRASPFPPPPETLQRQLESGGVVLAFTPSGS